MNFSEPFALLSYYERNTTITHNYSQENSERNDNVNLEPWQFKSEESKSNSSNIQAGFILKLVVMVIILVVGTVGNTVVFMTIGRTRQLHRAPFFFVISLAVSDLSRSVFCLPFVMASVIQGSVWAHGALACTLTAFANSFFVFSSFLSILSISIDRYISISYSRFHRMRLRGLTNLAAVAIGWLVACAVSLPPVFGVGSYTYIKEEFQCTFRHKSYRQNNTLGFLLVLTAVAVGTFVAYIRIFHFLRRHRKMKPLQQHPARSDNWTFFGPGAIATIQVVNQRPLNQVPTITQNLSLVNGEIIRFRRHKNEHLTRTFFIMTVIIYCLWAMYIFQAYIMVFTDVVIPTQLRSISSWLTYLQVCVCPLIFVASIYKSNIGRCCKTTTDQEET